MHPNELRNLLGALVSPLGRKATAFAMVNVGEYSTGKVAVGVSTDGQGATIWGNADTWEAAIAEAREKVAQHLAERSSTIVRRMALTVIEISAEHGCCTEEALLKAGYSKDDVARHGLAACKEAARLSRAAMDDPSLEDDRKFLASL